MNTYKITNLTHLAGKRDIKYNSILDIEYVDSMIKKTIKLNPGETVFLQISNLPLSVHRLRVKKLISVLEISETELNNNINASKPVAKTKEIDDISNKKANTIIPKKKEKDKIIKKPYDDEITENE